MVNLLRVTAVLGLFTFSLASFAGAKEDFVNLIKSTCGKSQEDAEKLATPGRTGNIMKVKTCTGDSVDVEGCRVSCSDASAKIGN